MTREQKDHVEKLLTREQERYSRLVHSWRQEGLEKSQSEASGELADYDQHMADMGAETFEREKDLGLLFSARAQLEQVEKARQRLAEGSYGICEHCQRQIPEARLAAWPAATACTACQERVEHDGRPLPEDDLVLTAGIWNKLAPYGTANSPQDAPEDYGEKE